MPHLLRLIPPLFLVLSTGCAINPVSGNRDFVVITESQELELGRRAAEQVSRQYRTVQDPGLQAYVNRIGQRLAATSHRPKLVWRFTVLDSPEVNAFALPGGSIYITRGLMAYLGSEAELAAVLAHEIGHVTARHGVTQVSKTAAFGLGLELLGNTIPELRNSGAHQNLMLLGDVLLKGYGREQELQSDRLGARYLARAGYDPGAMRAVIGVLKSQEEYEKRRAAAEGRRARVYHGVLATHPDNDRRLREIVAEARSLKATTTAAGRSSDYLTHLQGLAFGESAQNGVVKGERFLHHDLNLAITFPARWQLSAGRQALLAMSPARDRMIQLEQPRLPIGDRNPRRYLQQLMKRERFDHEQTLVLPNGQAAHLVVATLQTPFGRRAALVVAIFHHERALVFLAAAKNPRDRAGVEQELVASLKRLRTLTPEERRMARGTRLQVIPAAPGQTFRALARRYPALNEDRLRLLNGRYPDGEPRPGETIKVVDTPSLAHDPRLTPSGEVVK